MTYSPIYPDWFFSYIEIPNLEIIKKELINFKNSAARDIQKNKHYFNIKANLVGDTCPALTQFLKETGIQPIFSRILYSANTDLSLPSYAHVDSYVPQYCKYSMNIPLEDCDESYVIWYKTKNIHLNDASKFGLDPDRNFATANKTDITEIRRLEYKKPFLMNTTVLHKGQMKTSSRTIAGLRFSLELSLDMLNRLGIKEPFIQID